MYDMNRCRSSSCFAKTSSLNLFSAAAAAAASDLDFPLSSEIVGDDDEDGDDDDDVTAKPVTPARNGRELDTGDDEPDPAVLTVHITRKTMIHETTTLAAANTIFSIVEIIMVLHGGRFVAMAGLTIAVVVIVAPIIIRISF
jgi:hypothetical protein